MAEERGERRYYRRVRSFSCVGDYGDLEICFLYRALLPPAVMDDAGSGEKMFKFSYITVSSRHILYIDAKKAAVRS